MMAQKRRKYFESNREEKPSAAVSLWKKMWRRGQRSADDGETSPKEERKTKRRKFWKKFWKKSDGEDQREREDQTEDPVQNEGFFTPDLSLSDLFVHVPRRTISSESVSSDDSFHTAVSSLTDFREDPEDGTEIRKINSTKYKMGEKLGEGGNGLVFKATRMSDGLKVAVKIVPMTHNLISVPAHSELLPKEIGLHIQANEGDPVPEIIRLLDWDYNDDEYTLVLEKPSPCMDLREFTMNNAGPLPEDLARRIMRQAIGAVFECLKRGVFHMDIKLENFLINPETFEIKLIDFGHASLLKETSYTQLLGSLLYWCPELTNAGHYDATSATVWSLGIILYIIMCWKIPTKNALRLINYKMWKKDYLTKECCSLVQACLQKDPNQRIDIRSFLQHKWFQMGDGGHL